MENKPPINTKARDGGDMRTILIGNMQATPHLLGYHRNAKAELQYGKQIHPLLFKC